jgi:hypothetical protein
MNQIPFCDSYFFRLQKSLNFAYLLFDENISIYFCFLLACGELTAVFDKTLYFTFPPSSNTANLGQSVEPRQIRRAIFRQLRRTSRVRRGRSGPLLEAAPPSERLATFRWLQCHVLFRGAWGARRSARSATSRRSNCRIWEGGEGYSHLPADRPGGSGSEKGGPTTRTNALCDLSGGALLGLKVPKIRSL